MQRSLQIYTSRSELLPAALCECKYTTSPSTAISYSLPLSLLCKNCGLPYTPDPPPVGNPLHLRLTTSRPDLHTRSGHKFTPDMTYGYIRVSSDKQTVENQRFEINNFCKRNGLLVDDWIEETISGTKAYTKRQLGDLLRKVTRDDIIICSELSRLGRNLFMIMEILNICMTKECRVWTIKDNYRLGDDIQSKVLAFAFGLSAEIERNLISQRTKEALARKRAEGVILGRPKGSKTAPEKHPLYRKKQLIKGLLEEQISLRKIAKICKCDRNTLSRYIKEVISVEK